MSTFGPGRQVSVEAWDQGPKRRRFGHRRCCHPAQRDVLVAVGPAADEHGRGLDGAVVLAERALLPVVRVRLLAQLVEHPRLRLSHPQPPLLTPAVPVDPRHGREHVLEEHVERPVGVVELLQRPAEVVDVVGVPVVRGEDRADRLQRGRPAHGGRERVEPTPRRPVHPDVAVRPSLRGEPRDRGLEVVELLRRVLALRDALGRAGAADVEATHRVPELTRETLVLAGVVRREVVLAVGEGLEQDGPWAGGLGKVEGCRQAHAVRHRDGDVLAGHVRGILPAVPPGCRSLGHRSAGPCVRSRS